MVVITVDNSYSKITGLASGPFNKLRKALSYSIDAKAAYFSNNRFNTVRYCMDKQGNFPTGLFNRVYEFFNEEGLTFHLDDVRMKYILKIHKVDHKPNFKVKPYDWQVKATDFIDRWGRGIISATTGSGKSLVIALIASRLCVKTLVVVPSLQIKEQLTASLMECFDDMSNITIENIDSNALKTAKGYDLLIIDEAHHVAAKTYHKLNKTAWTGIYHRVFLTATPFRNQNEETMLFEGIAGTGGYQLTYKEAVLQKLIVPIEAYYIEVPKQTTNAVTWAQVYSQLVVNNEQRNKIISDLLWHLFCNGRYTLCLVKEIAHGNILKGHTGGEFANGQDDDTRQFIKEFNKGIRSALIGTTGILGEGVDTKPCEYVIIAGLGKAKSAFMQQVGRAVRKYSGKTSAKVIIFSDKSHKFTKAHFKEQKKILLDEYGVIPIKLDL